MLFPKLKPTFHAENIYGVDFLSAWQNGLRGLILDIDNTLVPHNAPINERCRAFLNRLKDIGYRMVIVSNNHEERAGSFAKEAGIPYLCDAGKPSPKKIREACRLMGLPEDQVLCIGDQLFTDIWGANNAGIRSLLTEPLDKTTDTAWIKVKRVPEALIKYLHNKEISCNITQDNHMEE